MRNRFLALGLISVVLLACRESPDAVPRPRAYPRVEYPARGFQAFDDADCPFTFAYPTYAHIEYETLFFGEQPAHKCWFDIVVPSLNARVHCSYLPIKDGAYAPLVKDAFTIANKINQRSNYMDEIRVANSSGVHGLIMEFKGPAASPMHFFLTDSTAHFFKAALYYNAPVRVDSLEPITAFLKEDIAYLINTFVWN